VSIMKIFSIFGISDKRIIADGLNCIGTVDKTKCCWWLKVNTKAVRMHALDGARFPHIVWFSYCANGKQYRGVRWVDAYTPCPQIGEKLKVWYVNGEPESFAVEI